MHGTAIRHSPPYLLAGNAPEARNSDKRSGVEYRIALFDGSVFGVGVVQRDSAVCPRLRGVLLMQLRLRLRLMMLIASVSVKDLS